MGSEPQKKKKSPFEGGGGGRSSLPLFEKRAPSFQKRGGLPRRATTGKEGGRGEKPLTHLSSDAGERDFDHLRRRGGEPPAKGGSKPAGFLELSSRKKRRYALPGRGGGKR